MKKKTRILTLALVLVLLLGGCVPGADITKRAIVTAAAVTLGEESYGVTVEILSHLGQEEQSFESHSGQGRTFAQAVTEIELEMGKTLYLDGCKVILLSGFSNAVQLEALLKEINTHGGIRPLTLVAADLGKDGLLEGEEAKKSRGEEVFSLLSGSSLSQVNLKDCLGLLSAPGRGTLIPGVELRDKEIRIGGYLSPGKNGVLQAPEELERLLPFAGKEDRQRVYTVTGEGYAADWVLEKSSMRLRPRTEKGETGFLLEARVEGYLLSGQGERLGGELLRQVQEDVCRQVLEEYAYVLEKIVRPSGNDLFSMGKHLELFDQKSWEDLGRDCGERLPEIPVELRSSVLLRDKKRLFDRN